MKFPKKKSLPTPKKSDVDDVGYRCDGDTGPVYLLKGGLAKLTDSDVPTCNRCHCKMSLYAQTDAVVTQDELSDRNAINTYVCFGCFTVKSLLTKAGQ